MADSMLVCRCAAESRSRGGPELSGALGSQNALAAPVARERLRQRCRWAPDPACRTPSMMSVQPHQLQAQPLSGQAPWHADFEHRVLRGGLGASGHPPPLLLAPACPAVAAVQRRLVHPCPIILPNPVPLVWYPMSLPLRKAARIGLHEAASAALASRVRARHSSGDGSRRTSLASSREAPWDHDRSHWAPPLAGD